jgi:uncharacterized protein (DUF885 family)
MPISSRYRYPNASFNIANLNDIRHGMVRFTSSFGLILTLLLTSCGGPDAGSNALSEAVLTPSVSAEQQRLENFFTATWAEDLVRYPASASYLGVNDRQDQWNDVTESFQLASLAITRQRLDFLNGIDTSQLSEDRLLSYRLYRLDLERTLAGAPFRHHRYVIHQFRGPHTSPVSLLINVHAINSMQDAEAYIARLNNLPLYFDGVVEQIQIRADKGLFLVDWMIPKIIESASNVLLGAPFDAGDEPSVIWADFNDKLDQLALAPAEINQLREDARSALFNAVRPAYQKLIAAVRSQQDRAMPEDGVWRFPDGEAFYANRLNVFTTTSLTAAEIHQAGLDNVERLHSEMRAVMAELGERGDLSAFLERVRSDQALRFPNTEEGRSAYLDAARTAIDDMAKRLPAYFGVLPRAELVVKRSAGKAFINAHHQTSRALGFITRIFTI